MTCTWHLLLPPRRQACACLAVQVWYLYFDMAPGGKLGFNASFKPNFVGEHCERLTRSCDNCQVGEQGLEGGAGCMLSQGLCWSMTATKWLLPLRAFLPGQGAGAEVVVRQAGVCESRSRQQLVSRQARFRSCTCCWGWSSITLRALGKLVRMVAVLTGQLTQAGTNGEEKGGGHSLYQLLLLLLLLGGGGLRLQQLPSWAGQV